MHCDRVTVDNLKIDNNLVIPNSDGLDIISSSNVNVSDCYISCGDDAIVLAGYDWHFGDPGFKRITRPSENINVSNCILRSRSSAIRIGGWDQNVMSDYSFSNITIFDSNCGVNINIRDYAGVDIDTFRRSPEIQIQAAHKLANAFLSGFRDKDRARARELGYTDSALLAGA